MRREGRHTQELGLVAAFKNPAVSRSVRHSPTTSTHEEMDAKTAVGYLHLLESYFKDLVFLKNWKWKKYILRKRTVKSPFMEKKKKGTKYPEFFLLPS